MTLRCGASTAARVAVVADGHPADVRLVRQGERRLISGLGD
jgi:hypothetical protein